MLIIEAFFHDYLTNSNAKKRFYSVVSGTIHNDGDKPFTLRISGGRRRTIPSGAQFNLPADNYYKNYTLEITFTGSNNKENQAYFAYHTIDIKRLACLK